MKPCIFCAIINQEQRASIIHEDDHFIAIMDAYPLTKGHVLVIPKIHVQRLNQLDHSNRNRLFHFGHTVMEAQKRSGFGTEGCNLLLNDGKAANQTVPHLHLHLIPREPGDLLRSLPKLALHITGLFGIKSRRSVLEDQANEISQHISSSF